MDLIAAGQPFLRRDCARAALTPSAFKSLVASRALRQVFRGCWVDTRVPDSRDLRIDAVELVRPPHAIACNETAAYLFGLDLHPPGRRHDFTPSFVVPLHQVRILRPGVDCREAIIPEHDVAMVGTVPCTTPVRTAADLLRRQYRPYALASADALARAGLLDPYELIEYLEALRGYRGIVQARQLAVLVDPRSDSSGESWTRLRIHDAGFPPPQVQWRVELRDGGERWLDLAYPERLVACEFDGRAFHTALIDTDHDRDRRLELTDEQDWRWIVARRETVFGPTPTFETELGALLGMTPRPRFWGNR